MDARRVTEELSVSPQISAADVPAIAAAGYRSIICNRPDGEGPGQPPFEEIEAAAKASGVEIRYQPVISGQMQSADVEAFGALMASLPKPVFVYCRSGTRSVTLWAFSEGGKRPLPEILEKAGAAGYDLSGVAPLISKS